MANISISDLFSDSESFMQDLSEVEELMIIGGGGKKGKGGSSDDSSGGSGGGCKHKKGCGHYGGGSS